MWTTNTKDAFENIKQVEEIVFSSYDACTQPDPEGDGSKFRAQVRALQLTVFLLALVKDCSLEGITDCQSGCTSKY